MIPEDDCTLLAKRISGERLLIVAGRQIKTKEGLEVLALLTTATFYDDQPLEVILDKIAAKNAITVLPWAVGKWLGRRGLLISAVLAKHKERKIILGDNGSRPVF